MSAAARAALEFLCLAQPGRDADRGPAAASWRRRSARVFDESRQTSGCRRVAAQLNREGHECSVGMVADLMRELGLAAVQPRAYKRTTVPGEHPVESPDLIGRDFTADRRRAGSQRLVGDITYLRTGEGWLYLATVIDLATRMVVGWQMANHMRTSLITDALQMAIDAGHVEPDAIFHSDRGTQYTSAEFATFCNDNRVRTSLGRTGVCWDNAAAESFFASLKNEMYHRQHVRDPGPSTVRCRRLHRGVLQPSAGCTPPSATAPRTKHSPTTEPQQPPHDQQPRICPRSLTHPTSGRATHQCARPEMCCPIVSLEEFGFMELDPAQRRITLPGLDRGRDARSGERNRLRRTSDG